MDLERLKELKAEFEKVRKYNNMHCMSTVTEDDVLELIDEAINNQPVTKSATSENVGMVIKLIQAYGKNIASKCQIEGTIFYDTGSPCARHRFGEDAIDTILTALQAYQPWVNVEDRLPDGNVSSVLIFTEDGGVAEGQYYPSIDSWKQFRWSVENSKVTHWRPLPESPKGE